ncbi:protein subunit release factor B [Haloferula luteola]|uniref:Protein subunit release factor B n=1 Tax=Haloferula luteola TaxID=595692 RepID=A0A840VFJ4_9BACT|nr:peptide chain release factor-like protein [Haloferula luteola]MBB5352589.1 protein subunit release factor B [Haloferula luteola]
MISPEKQAALEERMAKLGVVEAELVEKFILGSGAGGQKINKTHSCVYLKHEPTGLEIKCQASRSRELNRFLARKELCDALDEIRLGRASKRRQEAEKIRRQKRRRSRRSKQRSIQDKRILSQKKNLRRSPGRDD